MVEYEVSSFRVSNSTFLGIALGVGTEACVIAAALSLPKTLFRIASPLIHTDADEYNEIVQGSFLSASQFDNGAYSEPMMMLQLFIQYNALPPESRFNWAMRHNIAHARLKLFVSLVIHLTQRVNHCLHNDTALDISRIKTPCSTIENRLRLILTWTFSDNLIVQHAQTSDSNEVQVNPTTPLTSEQLQKLLPPDSIEYSFGVKGKRIYSAPFGGVQRDGSLHEILKALMHVSERQGIDVVWIDQRSSPSDSKKEKNDGILVFGVGTKNRKSPEIFDFLKNIFQANQLVFSEILEDSLHYVLMIAENVKKKQTKLLKDLSCQFENCLSIQLRDNVDPKLTVNNCAVDESDLSLIFSGDPSPLQPCKVSTETVSEHQIISFPPAVDEDVAKPLGNSLMIDDLPIGYRLLATYGLGYKDK